MFPMTLDFFLLYKICLALFHVERLTEFDATTLTDDS